MFDPTHPGSQSLWDDVVTVLSSEILVSVSEILFFFDKTMLSNLTWSTPLSDLITMYVAGTCFLKLVVNVWFLSVTVNVSLSSTFTVAVPLAQYASKLVKAYLSGIAILLACSSLVYEVAHNLPSVTFQPRLPKSQLEYTPVNAPLLQSSKSNKIFPSPRSSLIPLL